MVQNGNALYGTTFIGGNNDGVIFQYDPSRTPCAAYALSQAIHDDGSGPIGNLAASGNFIYGVTQNGGANGKGVIFKYDIIAMHYTKLYDFGGTNGETPMAGLTLSGKLLYGTTSAGGASGNGVVFQYDTSANAYSVLFSFTGHGGAFGGSLPQAELTSIRKLSLRDCKRWIWHLTPPEWEVDLQEFYFPTDLSPQEEGSNERK